MKKQISQSVFPFNDISKQSVLTNSSKIRKIQGVDTVSTTKSKIFTNKVQNIKNKPKKEVLEDQYIQGLQDQIHYLEMQLKLLKEKQIAKHSQVDQLEAFFGDGIPINENILGMKNEFNCLKNQTQEKLKKLQNEVQQREDLLKGLKSKNNLVSRAILQTEETAFKELQKQANKREELINLQAKIKRETEICQLQIKNCRGQNRKMKEKINALQRNKEINMVTALKYNTHKHNHLNQTRQSIKQKQTEYQKLLNTFQEMKRQEQNQQYVLKMEQENLRLKKKKIVTEKQYHAILEKINEKKLELEIKLKERQKEINARMEAEARLQKNKELIDTENSLSAQELEKIAKQRQVKALEKLVDQNKKTSKYVHEYSILLSKLEDSIEELGIRRPDLKREIQSYENEQKQFQEQYMKQKQKQIELYGNLAGAKATVQRYQSKIPQITDKIRKNTEKVKLAKSERERLHEDIRPKEKQLQLIEILKSFDLEGIELCNASNTDIQETMFELMKNWDTLSKK